MKKQMLLSLALIFSGKSYGDTSVQKKVFGQSFPISISGSNYVARAIADSVKVRSFNSNEVVVFEAPMIEVLNYEEKIFPFFGISQQLNEKTPWSKSDQEPNYEALNAFCKIATNGRNPIGKPFKKSKKISIQALAFNDLMPSESGDPKLTISQADIASSSESPLKIRCARR